MLKISYHSTCYLLYVTYEVKTGEYAVRPYFARFLFDGTKLPAVKILHLMAPYKLQLFLYFL